MKVRKIIEMLAKCDWDSEIRMDLRSDSEVAPADFCKIGGTKRIQSISQFTSKGKHFTTLNTRNI